MTDNSRLDAGRRIAKITFGRRRPICVTCEKVLRGARSDAEFCSNRCRQAAHRKKEARAKAESYFKTQQAIAQNAAQRAWKLDHHQRLALMLNVNAESVGAEHLRYMGIQQGILAVQATCENDLRMRWGPDWTPPFIELKHDPTNPEAGDPEVIEAVVDALKRETLSGSFMQREYEKECQALLRGPVRRIALFVEDPEWLTKAPPGGWPTLPIGWADDYDDWDLEPLSNGLVVASIDSDGDPGAETENNDRDTWIGEEECQPIEGDWGGPPVTDN